MASTTSSTKRRRGAAPAGTDRRDQKALPSLSGDQLAEMLGLIKAADSVELKLSVPDVDQRSVVASLGMDPLDAQIRQVTFFDTPDLALDKAGVVVRVRRIQGRPADSVVKLRPVVPSALPANVRKSPLFGVEVDAMPGGFVCSGRMKAEVDADKATQWLPRAGAAKKLLTKEQRALYAAHAPKGLALEDLHALGPITVLKLKFVPGGFDRRMVAELWFYPDGSRILELSTKCLPTEAFQVSAEAKAFLAEHGIDLSGAQQTKTRTALDFFARELTAAQVTESLTETLTEAVAEAVTEAVTEAAEAAAEAAIDATAAYAATETPTPDVAETPTPIAARTRAPRKTAAPAKKAAPAKTAAKTTAPAKTAATPAKAATPPTARTTRTPRKTTSPAKAATAAPARRRRTTPASPTVEA